LDVRRLVVWACAAPTLACLASAGWAQQVAGSVEAGLENLGQRLLAGMPPGQRPALSVMPFPGADQSCPVLSVFVVDELTTTLVSSVQPRPRVVERQQLETIIAQNRLDEFLSDPEQRRRLGGLSGIQALVVGSFAVIGDRLRINARLVAIDSGETIAAHAVSVPRTSEITELLRQSSGRGRNCLVDPAPAARAAAPANSPTIPPTRLPLPGEACDEQDGVRVCAQGLRRTGRDTQLTLVIENLGDAPIAVGTVGPSPTLTGDDGTTLKATHIGFPTCGAVVSGGYMGPSFQADCLNNDSYFRRSQFRAVPSKGRVSATLVFQSGAPAGRTTFTLGAALGILPTLPSTLPDAEAAKLQARLLHVVLPNVRPTDAQP
jgi:TolB-like protein